MVCVVDAMDVRRVTQVVTAGVEGGQAGRVAGSKVRGTGQASGGSLPTPRTPRALKMSSLI